MLIRKATVNDIGLLIKLRIDYLLDENKIKSIDDVDILKVKLHDYYEKWIPVNGFIAYIAEDNNNVFSTAFLSIVERPPRTADTSYLVGTVYNVYTYPNHRRKGIATKVMQALLSEAKQRDVASIDLLSTDDGKHLYEKLGFELPSYTFMRVKLKKHINIV